MGLASFNRMRRSRLEVEEMETERFKKDNEARWAAHHARNKLKKSDEKAVEKIAEAELAAAEKVGEKAVEGMKMAADGEVPDLPLRKDHAAEIVGRTLQHDPQGEPLDPIDRLHERVPPEATKNEELVAKTPVDREGPSAEEVKAAAVEMAAPDEKKTVAKAIDAENARAEARHEAAVESKKERGVKSDTSGDSNFVDPATAETKAAEKPAADASKSEQKAATADSKTGATSTMDGAKDPLDHDGDGKKGGSLPKSDKK